MGLLIITVVIIYLVLLLFTECTFYDKKHGLKHTFTYSGVITEWDFNSPLTLLKLLKIFILSEDNTEQRNKYIRQYTRLKKSLEETGYDLSDFKDYRRNNE